MKSCLVFLPFLILLDVPIKAFSPVSRCRIQYRLPTSHNFKTSSREARSIKYYVTDPTSKTALSLMAPFNSEGRVCMISYTRKKLRIIQRGKKRSLSLVLIFLFYLFGRIPPASAASAISRTPQVLGMRQLIPAFTLVMLVAGLGLSCLGLTPLARQLILACSRCALQLQLLGGIILHWLLPTNQPLLVWAWVLGVGFIASKEAHGRLGYKYPRLRLHVTISFLLGGLFVMAYAIVMQLFGRLQPWYQPQTIIPLAGMLFGNTLSAVTLGASALTRGFAEDQREIELYLARGATWQEAVLPLITRSISTALTPTINALSITGIVHLPGMMTGQILAGQSPRQAAIYQTLIWFLIASVATGTIQLVTSFVLHELVDKRQHCLLLSDLKRFEKNGTTIEKVVEIAPATEPENAAKQERIVHVVAVPMDTCGNCCEEATSEATTPAFCVERLRVNRVSIELSFQANQGDRIGIMGASGSGKSQTLRTLVGLERRNATDVMFLKGSPILGFSWPEWRTRVCLVSQDRPTSRAETPRETYQHILNLRKQSKRKKGSVECCSTEWNLPPATFDRPWATLSGGEAQRASLAIALALEPEVLLLDEMSSALDEATTLQVEATLKSSGITIILVTHDCQQLQRFCTQRIDLPSR